MEVIKTVKGLKDRILLLKNDNKSIGFVPTMGALHDGHISLIKESLLKTEITICSIFVNPIQFNNVNDLAKYPRTLEKDVELLTKSGCQIIFAPSIEEIYPTPDLTVFDFGTLDIEMEGKFRKGHFNGMAIVVKRLFEIVEPTMAFFGQKDFQQLAIINYFTIKLNIPVQIISCPTLREKDGLAMSSRNMLLNADARKIAPKIFEILSTASKKKEEMNPKDLKNWVEKQFSAINGIKLEYFEIVDTQTLLPVYEWNQAKQCVGCVAAYITEVRLIDNILL